MALFEQILSRHSFAFLCIAFLSAFASADLNNDTSPTSFFHTRPELHAPIIHFDVLWPDFVSPGYIFLAPYRNIDPGPYIYDNHGNLVWSGAGFMGPMVGHAPRVCNYQGKDHLCFYQGEQYQGFARGHGLIVNDEYRIVKTVESGGSAAQADMHEFRVLPDGKTALITVYQTRQYDLSPFGIEAGMGWVVDSVFQEVDIETGDVVFEWRALDHISPSFSYSMPDTTDTSGTGRSADRPWDYFHINSIDKNDDGDYLVSARHMAAVYKLSGVDGHVMWELNGANPSFLNIDLHFSSQHHARWTKENGTHTLLTLFDNASNNFNITNPWSRGMAVAINHIDRTASMTKEWLAPDAAGGVLAGSQGSIQTLKDDHVMIGWGDHPFFSEHLATGEAVMYGKIAIPESGVMNYRAYKFEWKATPKDNPALFTYSRTGTSVAGMVFYVSWNGATEVKEWKCYGSNTAEGPWETVARANKTGFETMLRTETVRSFAFAEAIDQDGHVLRRSSVTKTFVPSAALMAACDDYSCQMHPPLAEGERIEAIPPFVADGGANWDTGLKSNKYYTQPPKTAGSFFLSIAGPAAVGSGILLLLAMCLYKHRAMRSVSGWQRSLQQKGVDLREVLSPGGVRSKLLGQRYRRVSEGEAVP
ncbi:ASST-domain-containing protein [Phyllosticta citrichinensis]|uniref:ASST-domain-containing protein n=1 Tax=Phyllosticta citrichinensis TaxID=1130410 RepID=A0ABR1XRN8_9PEZI